MEDFLCEDLEDCFRYGKSGEAIKVFDEHEDEIDLDDEEDVEDLFGLLEYALTRHAAEDGINFLKHLISKGLDIEFKLAKRKTLLFFLAESDIAPEVFGKVVDLGANVFAQTRNDDTILSRAIFYRPLSKNADRLPSYLIEKFGLEGFDRFDCHGMTPLMCAVIANRPALVDLIIKKGADVNATGGLGEYYGVKMNGVSPFALACREGNYEMAKKLLDMGADETLCDADGTPASFCVVFDSCFPEEVCEEKKTEIISLLKNPGCVDSQGNTMLITALTWEDYKSGKKVDPDDNEEIVRALIASGIDVNAKNNDGVSALHMAALYLYVPDMLKDLIDAGADINITDNDGNTALILACRKNRGKAAIWLLKNGADYKIKDKTGKTAMDYAAQNGMTETFEFMI